MSDNGAQQPLSRRERRLREMQQSGVTELPDEFTEIPVVEPEPVPETSPTDEIEIDESEIEVPETDEQGNLLSRRERRVLREQAIEALKAQKLAERRLSEQPQENIEVADAPQEPAVEISEPLPEEPQTEEPDSTGSAEELEAHDVPTEAFSLDDLREIIGDEEEVPAESVATVLEDLPATSVLDTVEDSEVTGDTIEPTDDNPYTFPDIKPLEEDRPVFDDPARRTVGSEAPQGTGFDDMIERAVADESASVHSGTSSLILPEIPTSDSIAGPIGTTGELFITGSIDLPKSLGETGGHSNIQDSVESDEDEDAMEMLNLTEMYETSEFDSAPVSASQAVSSRQLDKTGITTPEVQKDSKKPLILASTGGGLILVLVGLGIWAAQSGFFG